jgi:predicted TIM-barrel fold metal-dependent hydrolase
MPGITVNEYRPKAMVRLKQTEVLIARYPVVDAHNHYHESIDLHQLIDTMDSCDVRVFVDLSGSYGDRFKKRFDLLKGNHPNRFAVFYTPDFQRINEPGFAEREARELEQAVRMGAQGLKIFKSLGLNIRGKDGKLLHVNDPGLFPIWETAGKLGVPILIHVADPFAFFAPLNTANERVLELSRHPSWHFYGADYPSLEQILEERDALLEQFPNTNWIGAHIGSESEDLDRTAQLLDRYPNYYVDFSAREAEIGRQPRRAQEFFIRFQDRIVFGTDCEPTAPLYQSYFRTLETADECYEYYGWPGQGLWNIYGLELPDAVLEKVYNRNAQKLIPGLTLAG